MNRYQLAAAAIVKYGFRLPRPEDDQTAYLAALIAHVQQRDWAAAEELRIGKPQADWTAADADAFQRRLQEMPRSAHELTTGVHLYEGLESSGHPVTAAHLLELADVSLEALMAVRRRAPTQELPIVATMLLTTGVVRLIPTSRSDRIAVIKAFARASPVFGFALIFDAFMHRITDRAKAEKIDAIVQHLGTRDLRLVRTRPYRVDGRRAIFEDPPPPDLDGRAAGPNMEDPYAEIFVTVAATGVPS